MSEWNQQIAQFYDRSTPLWQETWGEHLHHGFYEPCGPHQHDHYRAQIEMINRIIEWSEPGTPKRILDAGCGVGGSAVYLAQRYGAFVDGITLSPVQVTRARRLAACRGMSDLTDFRVADALDPPFPDASFDLVWSLESAEHMEDKQYFLAVCRDLLKPGGKLAMATWCHRPTPRLSTSEKRRLQKIYAAYQLPYITNLGKYANLCREVGFQDVKTADWTEYVLPFWPAVIKSALKPAGMRGLLSAGLPAIRAAIAAVHMVRGYRSGLLRFGLLSAVR